MSYEPKYTDPKRYSPYYHSPTKEVEFEEDRFGKWVKWEDIIPLLERLDKLTKTEEE